MQITGKVHCLFEQSGTFKNEFKKLGFEALDYDIQNNFGETDYVIDLFAEIDNAYLGGVNIFDTMSCEDLTIAFYPCIYFSCMSQMSMSWTARNYRNLSGRQATEKILERSHNREIFFARLVKMLQIARERGLRLILENPYSLQTFLKSGFVQPPSIIDTDRTRRGDYFVKPTAYWFINCEPTHGFTPTEPKFKKSVMLAKKGKEAGICSEERSMISPDYARNFICDFIIGKEQQSTQKNIIRLINE